MSNLRREWSGSNHELVCNVKKGFQLYQVRVPITNLFNDIQRVITYIDTKEEFEASNDKTSDKQKGAFKLLENNSTELD